MRWFAAIAIASWVSCLILNGFDVIPSLHYRLASDLALKGKEKDGSCMDYALALSSKLSASGINGQLIFYKWRIKDTQITGSHVLVLYHLADRTQWIVDNEIPHPKLVPSDANLTQPAFLLGGDLSAPVDVELQEGLNRLSYF
jgi:hypothetical protein